MIAILLGVAFLACAATCWYADQRSTFPPYHLVFPVTKVAATLILIALAVALGAMSSGVGWAVLAALALGVVGDAALLSQEGWTFPVGFGAFLAGHVAYLFAFAAIAGAQGPSLLLAVLGAVLVAPFAVRSLPRVRRALLARGDVLLGQAVLGYGAVLCLLAVVAGLSGQALAMVGAVLFTISDAVLALDRFVGPRARAGLVVLSTYHLAQLALVVGALTA